MNVSGFVHRVCRCAVFGLSASALYAVQTPYVGVMMPDDPRLPFADPFVLTHEGRYYAYGTSANDGIAVAVSDDLRTWKTGMGGAKGGLALHKEDSYGKKWFWAPEVFRRGDGKFVLYYSADQRCCAALADSPLGPFVQDRKVPMLDADKKTIDHTLFVDDDASAHLFFVWQNKGNRIWSVGLEDDLVTPKKEAWRFVSEGSEPWECLQPCNEGPSVVKHDGRYHLFYSANDFCETGYGVGVAVADDVRGPWRKEKGNPVLRFFEGLPGVGHGAPFRDLQGDWKYVFHAHCSWTQTGPRCMYVADFDFTDKPPYVKIRPGVVECRVAEKSKNGSGDFPVPVRVVLDAPSHRISKDMYGLFLEDISLSVDGCFYPELVWNRGFDFPATNSPGPFRFSSDIQGWCEDHAPGAAGRVTIRYGEPKFTETPAYLRIEAFSGGAGVKNTGAMREMSVAAEEPLELSLWARGGTAFAVQLRDPDGRLLAPEVRFVPEAGEWRRFETVLKPAASERNAALRLCTESAGVLDLEQVSLMPKARFRGRKNGLRKDIAQLFADLRPSTFRFPGGCMLEGNSFASWYDWKLTVGPVEERVPIWNVWGYHQTLGLGYFEYLQFCEDIGAKPVPVFLAGITCQMRRPASCAAMESTGYFLTNVLDGIEFARGGLDTKWGRVRAEMGHPEPFDLEYVAIGNENRYDEYFDRYDEMAKALRKLHPDIKLVTCVDPAGYFNRELLDYSWGRISKENADVADEHIYGSPSWWLNNAHMYDAYPRKGVDVYVGEWATRNASDPYINSMYNAVCEAAFRMGFERNADLVKMSAYAPLVRRVGFPGNRYSLISLDGVTSCGVPGYWCEKMFTDNRPERTVAVAYPLVRCIQPAGIDRLKCRDCGNPDSKAIEVVSFHAVGGVDGRDLVLKIANAEWRPRKVEIKLGAEFSAQQVFRSVLTAAPEAKNTPSDPRAVVPQETRFSFAGGSLLATTVPACSVTVLRLQLPNKLSTKTWQAHDTFYGVKPKSAKK